MLTLKINHSHNLISDFPSETNLTGITYDTGDLEKELRSLMSPNVHYSFYSKAPKFKVEHELIYLPDFSELSLAHLNNISLGKRTFYFSPTTEAKVPASLTKLQRIDFVRLIKKSSLNNWKIHLPRPDSVDKNCLVLNTFLALGAQLANNPDLSSLEIIKDVPLSLQHGICFFKIKI